MVLETELIRRAVRGEQEALAALLERHGPLVRRDLRGAISRRWQGVLCDDDIMQQTYVDAFRSIHRFRPRDDHSFAAWLRTVARRNLLDAVKMLAAEKRGGARRRAQPGDIGEAFDGLAVRLGTSSITASRVMARDEARVALRRAIESLPETYRQVLQMYDINGQPADQVAEALSRSIGAVYMIRARALRMLAELMGTASRYLSDLP